MAYEQEVIKAAQKVVKKYNKLKAMTFLKEEWELIEAVNTYNSLQVLQRNSLTSEENIKNN